MRWRRPGARPAPGPPRQPLPARAVAAAVGRGAGGAGAAWEPRSSSDVLVRALDALFRRSRLEEIGKCQTGQTVRLSFTTEAKVATERFLEDRKKRGLKSHSSP